MWLKLFVGLVCLSFFCACATREQGCLDPFASNFDLTAEKACDDCCDYPVLSISLSQLWNDSAFNINDTLVDAQGDRYRILDLKYFLSSWVLYGTGPEIFTVDSAQLGCTPPVTYSPDIALVDARQFTYQLGVIRNAPVIDSICVSLGLDTQYPCIAQDSTNAFTRLTMRSPLWDEAADALRTMRLVLQRDLSVETFDTLYIDISQRAAMPLFIEFDRGEHTSLRVSVNYQAWFGNADAQDPGSFASAVQGGFPGSMFATP